MAPSLHLLKLLYSRKPGCSNTSSPYHPQSNGKAENAVQTVKCPFTNSKESGQSEFLPLLDWHNTLTEGICLSPTQCLMGHRCKTPLPVAGTLLKPCYSTEQETCAILETSSTSSTTTIGMPNHCTQLNLEKLWA